MIIPFQLHANIPIPMRENPESPSPINATVLSHTLLAIFPAYSWSPRAGSAINASII